MKKHLSCGSHFGSDDPAGAVQFVLDQMEQMQNMGSMEDMLKMIPGASKLGNLQVDEKQLAHTEAIILSMTPGERQNPSVINASRRKRIAAGSGTSVEEVNKVLKQFEQMLKMMKQFSDMGKTRQGKKMLGRMKIPF